MTRGVPYRLRAAVEQAARDRLHKFVAAGSEADRAANAK
jgi:hypothetical protein